MAYAPPWGGAAPSAYAPVAAYGSDPKERTVYVGNVGAACDEAMIASLFAHCGTVTGVRVAGDPTFNARFAFVEFADAR
jgi:RNA recognition motif-containing protein